MGRKTISKKALNILYIVLVVTCFAYGIGSITYANASQDSPNLVITYNQNGEKTITGDLFGNELLYPGNEINGILRITNHYKKADISILDLAVAIESCKEGLNKDEVYNSFIENMKLTIKKGTLGVFERTIVEDKSLSELLSSGIRLSPLGYILTGNSMDLEYTLKMAEDAGDELEKVVANIDFMFNADGIVDDDDDDNQDDKDDKDNKDNESSGFAGGLINRMKGYIALTKATKINEPLEEVNFTYNNELIEGKEDYSARVYYWNEIVEKWIALASYSDSSNGIKAINDGGYRGWFNVFGVIQPRFTDIEGHWAEPITNRMNGLEIVEGYPGEGLIRPARLEEEITRAEFTTLLYRLLNINPDRPLLETFTLEQSRSYLYNNFKDAAEIPDWVACMVASTAKAELVHTREGRFEADEPITRLEAAVMVSNAFKFLKQYQPIDLSKFKDLEDIPDWAKAALAENVVEGYPDSTFRPNDFITRAEALTVLKRLFVMGMGL